MIEGIKWFFKVSLYQPLYNILIFFVWLVPGHSIGWAIILLTVLVRLILWAPSVKSLRSPMELKEHQDDIKALQEKHKDDKQAQTQALMAFYKEKGVNPLSGCLPLLIQLPILWIMYKVFMVGLDQIRPDLIYSFIPHIDGVNVMFLWKDLTTKDRFVWPIIAALSQFIQSKQMAMMNGTDKAKSDDPQAAMTKQMTYIFPFMTYFIASSLPAGLALYWTVTSVFSIAQQYYVFKTFKPSKKSVQVTVRQK